MAGTRLEPGAAVLLDQIAHGAVQQGDQTVNYALPQRLFSSVLSESATRDKLRQVSLVSRRPLFDPGFTLCGPGYHAGSGLLVHGEEVPRLFGNRPRPRAPWTASPRT